MSLEIRKPTREELDNVIINYAMNMMEVVTEDRAAGVYPMAAIDAGLITAGYFYAVIFSVMSEEQREQVEAHMIARLKEEFALARENHKERSLQ